MKPRTPLFALTGPTASGKTGIAHRLADRYGYRLLSVDSMMVYCGLDIGTAKPTPDEIRRYDYAGLNLTDPGSRFTTGDWLRAVADQLDDRPTLAVGGTGLYFRGLLQGLDTDDVSVPDDLPDDADALRELISAGDPSVLDKMADPHNPRRLARALARMKAGIPQPWENGQSHSITLPVLRRPTEVLNERIHTRATHMFADGLLEETRHLLATGKLTGTAAQAIGYREAAEVLAGSLSQEQAVEAVAVRTRQYAKRQRTWFRNQMDAHWIDIADNTDPDSLADAIAAFWSETGPLFPASFPPKSN